MNVNAAVALYKSHKADLSLLIQAILAPIGLAIMRARVKKEGN